MTKKKILFTSHVAYFQRFNQPFMQMLRKQGHEVHYASMGEFEIENCDKSFVVPFARSPFSFSNIVAIRRLKKIIDTEDYDLIHTHTPMGSIVTRLAARTARKKGTKVIYTAHGFHFFKGAPLLNWLIYYPIEKIMARLTDTIITINQEDYVCAKAKFRTNVVYIPGVGVDPARFKKLSAKEKTTLRSSLGLSAKDFVMIYPAELNTNKNQIMLLRVMKNLAKKDPSIHLLLPGRDSSAGHHKKKAIEFNIAKNIHFLGHRNDIPNLMQAADLSVSTSFREGLPVNLMEAMFAGLPIVATRCRGATELVDDGVNGFITGFDDQEFIDAIEKIRNDKKLYRTLSKNSLARSKKYDISYITEAINKLYSRALQRTIIHLLASNSFSGAENVACETIQNTSNNYQIYYCSPSGKINEALLNKRIEHIVINSLSMRELKKVVRSYRPDIIHAHDFKTSILASRLHKQTTIISHIHQNPTWLNTISVRSLAYKTCSKFMSHIVLVTESVRDSRLFKGLAPNKVTVVRNTIDEKGLKKAASRYKTQRYDYLFCGRLEEIKQPLDFLQIILNVKKHHSNVNAVMIGDGSLYEECQQFVEKNNLKNNVTMTGFLTNPYPYMKNSNYLIITSKSEGFGLVAAEATILGAGVVSYRIPAISELLGDDVAYNQSNPSKVADFLISDTTKLRRDRLKRAYKKLSESVSLTSKEFRDSILSIYSKVTR